MSENSIDKNSESPDLSPNYKRTTLSEILPLKSPLSIDYFLVSACNLRCIFCGYSSSRIEYKYHQRTTLDLNLFKKSIDDMKLFSRKIKTIHFMGYGEPLLHKNIADMVTYAVNSNVSEKVDIITNGTLLSNKQSIKLIESKLDCLRISVNGLSNNDYKNNCGVNLDFKKYIDNIAFFFNNRGKTKLYIKILDYMLETKVQKENFYQIFKPICDDLYIEHMGDYVDGIDFNGISKNISGLTLRGTKKSTQKVCPMPFYMLRINPTGECTPCCEPRFNISLGNILNTSLPEIWNGEKFNRFRYEILGGADKMDGICKICKGYKSSTYTEDNLDNNIDKIRNYYSLQS